MWLINTETLKLEEYLPEQCPPYAILSHRWGNSEVSFNDFKQPNYSWKNNPGASKIEKACQQASLNSLGHIWIDTCCINKESSAELSEAINSMFNWYASAEICYVYLADVFASPIDEDEFIKSVWFTRGWTLQELLGPKQISFYNHHWQYIGSKYSLIDLIQITTSIDRLALEGHHLSNYLVAQKMFWASKRTTTRKEDTAYCLMGIFDVNMPLLYGEGSKAFYRLQEEIMKTSNDHSIFAWQDIGFGVTGLLAESPSNFKDNILSCSMTRNDEFSQEFTATKRGISITYPLRPWAPNSNLLRYIQELFSIIVIDSNGVNLQEKQEGGVAYTYCEDQRARPIFILLHRNDGITQRIHGMYYGVGVSSLRSWRGWGHEHCVASLKDCKVIINGRNASSQDYLDTPKRSLYFFCLYIIFDSPVSGKVTYSKPCNHNQAVLLDKTHHDFENCSKTYIPRAGMFPYKLQPGEYGLAVTYKLGLEDIQWLGFGFDFDGLVFLLAFAEKLPHWLTNNAMAKEYDSKLKLRGTTLHDVFVNKLIDEDYSTTATKQVEGLNRWLQANTTTIWQMQSNVDSMLPRNSSRSYPPSADGIWAIKGRPPWSVQLATYDSTGAETCCLHVHVTRGRGLHPFIRVWDPSTTTILENAD